jgi:hypothetical protein
MKMQTSAAATMAFFAEKKIDDIKQSFWFRAAVFALSVAGGILFSRLLHAGFAWLPSLGVGAHGKVSPLVAVLKMLRSGMGN